MIGVIADDLTGAAELGGVGWRYGLNAEVQVGPERTSTSELVAIDTDSRECAGDKAARLVEESAKSLQLQGAQWIYKKVDSVLRGPVLSELEAALAALRLKRALLVPANPGLGRVIRGGRYFIAGKFIHESDFRNDPQHPVRSSHVLEMLGPGGVEPVSVCVPQQLLPALGIVVGEAARRDHLMSWARHVDGTVLPAGGAEFFAAILEVKGYKRRAEFSPWERTTVGRTVFVCGSVAASTREFLKECRRHSVPVFCLPPELMRSAAAEEDLVREWAREIMAAFQRHQQVTIAIDRPLVRDATASHRLGACLVAAAKAVSEQGRVSQLYVEGGATAAMLVRSMGWSRLRVIRELAPGVVMMQIEPDVQISLTIKPGSYAWPDGLWHSS